MEHMGIEGLDLNVLDARLGPFFGAKRPNTEQIDPHGMAQVDV